MTGPERAGAATAEARARRTSIERQWLRSWRKLAKPKRLAWLR